MDKYPFGMTKSQLIQETGVSPGVLEYMRRTSRLRLMKNPGKRGHSTLYHRACIKLVKRYMSERENDNS